MAEEIIARVDAKKAQSIVNVIEQMLAGKSVIYLCASEEYADAIQKRLFDTLKVLLHDSDVPTYSSSQDRTVELFELGWVQFHVFGPEYAASEPTFQIIHDREPMCSCGSHMAHHKSHIPAEYFMQDGD